MQYIVISPLGPLTVKVVNARITSVVFGEKREREDLLEVDTDKTNETNLTKEIQKQLDSYFAGKLKAFDLPLHYQGTAFQMKVWEYLQTISYGQTVSYQTVAKAIGHPKSVRTVGTACKRNPIPIIIPCHRVINSSGEIGEYVGGRFRKEILLEIEKTARSS